MAERTAIAFGDRNYGFQVGQNSGSIHLYPERPETPPKPSFTVPFRRDRDFVKRESILNQIHEACLGPASRAALVGLGGVGKSQLAIEHAYRMRDMFARKHKEVWVFWVHAGTRARVEEGFRTIADTVKIQGRDQPNADILHLVHQWLQNEANGQWFMILDSADDIDVFYDTDKENQTATTGGGAKRALWTYLPQSENGSILVTTRNTKLGYRLTGGRKTIIEVGLMDQTHALQLLATKLGSRYDRNDGMELIKELGCMPLAINQAAAYIRTRAPRISIKTYLDDFRRSDSKKSSLLNYDDGDLRRDRSVSNSVIATLQISFDYIRSKRPTAMGLLSLLSFFDPQGISEHLVRPIYLEEGRYHKVYADDASVTPSEALNNVFEEDIATLRNYCLISTNEAGDTFEMHGLVQLSTRKWLDAHGKTEAVKSEYIHRMAQLFPKGHFENWETCRQLFPHVERAIDYDPTDEESLKEWALLLFNGSWYSLKQGKYAIAETLARKSHRTRQTLLGSKHPETLVSLAILASTYWHQGRWKKAESLELQVLEMSKTVLGPDHPDTLASMANLASTYRQQGRWKKAESLGLQVLEISKTVLGPDHPDTLATMGNLASSYWHQGRWEKAESLELQVLEMRKTVLGPDHPDTLTTMGNLASTYWQQGRWKKAESLELQVLEMRKTVLGPDHPATLFSMENLAFAWKSQGRSHDALKLLEKSHHASIRVLGPEHPDTRRRLTWLEDWRDEEPRTRERRRKPMDIKSSRVSSPN
ncbi:P-loop containing nucleoside triphosphate hydrolase protein [Nemania serpens]|nr:P-loop containing nucleoside triphosphate hydrolase protein [Nemania serpens]